MFYLTTLCFVLALAFLFYLFLMAEQGLHHTSPASLVFLLFCFGRGRNAKLKRVPS